MSVLELTELANLEVVGGSLETLEGPGGGTLGRWVEGALVTLCEQEE